MVTRRLFRVIRTTTEETFVLAPEGAADEEILKAAADQGFLLNEITDVIASSVEVP